jgi:hypothetical protein
MLYIIAFLLLCLVLAIPAARNTLFVMLGSAAALAVVGLILLGLGLLGMWLYSLDGSSLSTMHNMNRDFNAIARTLEILSPSPTLETVLVLAVVVAVVWLLIYDERKLRK